MSAEHGFSPRVYVWDDWAESKHDRDSTKEEYKYSDNDKTPRNNGKQWRVHTAPRNDTTKVNEE